jgi:hypothetical protein
VQIDFGNFKTMFVVFLHAVVVVFCRACRQNNWNYVKISIRLNMKQFFNGENMSG